MKCLLSWSKHLHNFSGSDLCLIKLQRPRHEFMKKKIFYFFWNLFSFLPHLLLHLLLPPYYFTSHCIKAPTNIFVLWLRSKIFNSFFGNVLLRFASRRTDFFFFLNNARTIKVRFMRNADLFLLSPLSPMLNSCKKKT